MKMPYILITGGSRGLGSFLAKYLAKYNYGIIINYKENINEAIKTKEEIAKISNIPPYIYQADITKENDVLKMLEFIKEKEINLEVVILNAGIDIYLEMPDKNYETFKKILDVNILGNFNVTKIFGDFLEEKEKGSLIYINSDNAIDRNDYISVEYDVSKSGLLMLAKDYSKYFKWVNVHTIAPGWLDTRMNNFPEWVKNKLNLQI